LPPKRLRKEIEDVQNPAVGASFFVVSLTVALFVSMFTTALFDPGTVRTDPGYIGGAGWIAGSFVLGWSFMLMNS
ncbi:MAG: hypothetical protein AAF125_26290, partial [Chloroflexota bacterium]